MNTDEIKKAKERAEQKEFKTEKIEDYKKNGAPLTGYQMKNDYGKLFVECEYAMGSNILFPLTNFQLNVTKLGMPSNKKGKLDFIFKKD